MNLEQKLENEIQKQIVTYGEFAQTKRTHDGLVQLEGFYDSVAEQMQRREEYIRDCEAEIARLNTLVEQSPTTLDQFEKHLKGVSWNLNRIATVLEQANSHNAFDSIVDQLRAKGSK